MPAYLRAGDDIRLSTATDQLSLFNVYEQSTEIWKGKPGRIHG